MMNVDMPKLLRFLEDNNMVNQLIRADKGSETDDVIRLGFELKKIPIFREYMEKNNVADIKELIGCVR